MKVVIIGIVGGLLAGALGTSVAPTIMMGLLYFKLVPDFSTAVGTTLLSILPPLSIFAAYDYYKKGEINVKYALILIVVCTIFTWVGEKLNHMLDHKYLKRILAGYLIFVAAYMFNDSLKN